MEDYITYTDHHFVNPAYPGKHVHWRTKKQPVYRLLDNKQWLDNFFTDGEIALSCFSKFRNYADEIRGDREEGDSQLRMRRVRNWVGHITKYSYVLKGIRNRLYVTILD